MKGVSRAMVEQLMKLGQDPIEFISRLKIVDNQGIERYFDEPFMEQQVSLSDFSLQASSDWRHDSGLCLEL